MIYETCEVKLPHKDYHGVKFDIGDDPVSELKLPVELVEMELRKPLQPKDWREMRICLGTWQEESTPNRLLEERWYELYLEKVMKYRHFILTGN